MRNYWSLMPVIAILLAVGLLYAVPTLINPEIYRRVYAVFRAEGFFTPLGRRRRWSRRGGAVAVLAVCAVVMGLQVSLNREANGCFGAAVAWGLDPGTHTHDPCRDVIVGDDSSGDDVFTTPTDSGPGEPVAAYQVGRPGGRGPKAIRPLSWLWQHMASTDRPHYANWIALRQPITATTLLVGANDACSFDLHAKESSTQVVLTYDLSRPCPTQATKITLVSITLKQPLGDRSVVTVGNAPVRRINPDMPGWGTVLGKLATGG